MTSLYIKDAETNDLAEEFARARGLTKTAAVKLALTQALTGRDTRTTREKMLAYWEEHPLPAELGPIPDKAFYDDLSGNL